MATKKIHEFAKRYVGIEETGLSDDNKKALHSQLRSDASAEGFDLSSISFGNILSQQWDSLKAEHAKDSADNLEKLKEEFKKYRPLNQ